MVALVSPGVSITIVDESQYLPSAVGTVPFLLFASSENKVINGVIAPGTKKTNAGKVYGISSQRELAATFGTPRFRTSAAGSPLHGHELNEYGLMAAYSALGLGSRVWAIRADINLDELVGTTVRPVGEVPNGTNWFDLTDTAWGIYQFNQSTNTFNNFIPMVITTWEDITVEGGISKPNQSIGRIGEYAVVVNDANNYVFYKNLSNNWVLVGSQEWQDSWPTVIGTLAVPDTLNDSEVTINETLINIPAGTPDNASIAAIINSVAIPGVTARVVNGFLALTVTALSQSSTILSDQPDGAMHIIDGPDSFETIAGISSGMYYAPALYFGSFNRTPAWSSFDASPRPTGSVWVKTSVTGGGTNFVVKQYNTTLKTWQKLPTPVFENGYHALHGLDPKGGGVSIKAGTMFVKYDTNNSGVLSFKMYSLAASGITSIPGSMSAGIFVPGSTFTMIVSQPGTMVPSTHNITLTGTTPAEFVSAIQAANIDNVTARVNNTDVITLVHTAGGFITLINTTIGSNPITTAGFSSSTEGVIANIVPGSITLTNWKLSRYTFSPTEPYTAPVDGTLWYYSDPTQVDIMICDTNGWRGYKNVPRDARGYNLQDTDPRGIIVTPTEPTLQTDGTDLVAGDLWLDTGDLENYPRFYRYTQTNKWQLIDNTDAVSQNGIIFADARWDGYSDSSGGVTDPVTGDYPSVIDMQYSDYIDLDAPDYRLFPRGTLLFNTRRSGYNVKQYISNHFNAQAYPNSVLPDVKASWVSNSGNKDDGTPYAGRYAQRAIIVRALKGALDGSLDIREEAYSFNLLVCPGYPELVPNLIALNNDRNNTGFIIGDTPLTLPANITELTQYNNTVAINRDPYAALYYPSGVTNDLEGNEIAVPPSHIILRTYIRNDNVSYPWFAPAGTRRGMVDNATNIGYVDARSGLFITTGINQGIRDAMYEMNLNPIALLNATGLVVYGQKTRSPTSTSLDRVNVARLVCYLRTVLQPIGNQFLFEPNDKITRDQIKSVIESVLNDLIAKRGLYDYLVVCDTSNNTPDRIARNELYVDVAIEPMKAVEFIYIPVRLKNPGAIKGGGA
jgi:hypothetical protein